DKGLQPADNPVFLMRKDKVTPAALKIVNAVSAKITTPAYNKMSLAINNDKEDPSDAAAAFLKASKLGWSVAVATRRAGGGSPPPAASMPFGRCSRRRLAPLWGHDP